MKKIRMFSVFLILGFGALAQEIVIKDYHYRLVSTELSAKEAIQQACKEALAETKEDKSDFEFGSFVIIAAAKPINFGVPAADVNQSNCTYLDFNKFFSIISGIRKEFSIMYLPYCIE